MQRWALAWLHSMLVTGLLMGMMMGCSLFSPMAVSTSSVNKRPTPDRPTCGHARSLRTRHRSISMTWESEHAQLKSIICCPWSRAC